MPIVTQNREISTPYPYSAHFNGVDVTGDLEPFTGNQRTVSYRTPRRLNRNNEEFLRQASLTGPELAAQLGQEYRKQYDTGNEFYTRKLLYAGSSGNHHVVKQQEGQPPLEWYDGPILILVPDPGGWDVSPIQDVPLAQVKVDGAKCIANTVPTKSEAALAQFLVELRDGIPYLFGTIELRNGVRNSFEKSSQSAYLNSEFGVKPFIGDLQRLGHAIKHAGKLAHDYLHQSGTIVRRRTTLYNRSYAGYSDDNRHYALLAGGGVGRFIADNGLTSYSDIITETCEFSGAYTYYVDKGHDFLAKLHYYEQLSDYLLGTDFNASTAWELMPWSWLVDWFSNVGTFISNVQALSDDSLVLRYGYVMHTQVCTRNLRQRGITAKPDWHGLPASVNAQVQWTIKQRHRATPYGFGIDLSLLSPRQNAILAALGLTHSDGNLRRRVS